MLWCLLLVALLSPDGQGLTSWLSCLLCFVTFPMYHGTHQNKGRGWRRETGLSPPVKCFLLTVTMRYFFSGSFMLFLSCVCYAFMRVCVLMPCGHLLGKG